MNCVTGGKGWLLLSMGLEFGQYFFQRVLVL